MINVFFVDDEERVLNSFKRLLQLSRNSYRFHFFLSGKEALASPVEPVVLITDAKMPEMDGYELIRRMKARFPSLVTVMLTGMVDPENPEHTDCDHHLEKPCDIQDILSLLPGKD